LARPSIASAHGESVRHIKVFGHADLLSIEPHRRARQWECQRISQFHPALVAAEHCRQPAAQPAAVELHVLVAAVRIENLLALGVTEPVQGELVMVAHEVGPLAGDVNGIR
jgi:hypothetical protein